MVLTSPTKHIKQSQKESLLMREIAGLLQTAALDEPLLWQAFITKVRLSPDGGICTLFFYTPDGPEHFEPVLQKLKLYRPSLRKALSQQIHSRRVPDIFFKFDDTYEKQQHIEEIFEKIKTEKIQTTDTRDSIDDSSDSTSDD